MYIVFTASHDNYVCKYGNQKSAHHESQMNLQHKFSKITSNY